jgi:adenylosuccinate synthase
MTNVVVVVGAQFGSEAKGAITALLCKDLDHRDENIRVAGPNAGHTVYGEDGREWKLRTIPVGAVASRTCQLHIAAGSEVDPIVLVRELKELDEAGYRASERLTIHPSATILWQKHHALEAELGLTGRIGSTGKGIGAARADRIMRRAVTWGDYASVYGGWAEKLTGPDGPLDLDGVGTAVIEGTQGYGLGLHTRQYPQVTSSDCRAIDFLAMAGISPWGQRVDDLKVILVARTFPIRVAGNSGPLLGETTWADLGLPEERTTVTNNVRRVGQWDSELLHEAIAANGGGDWGDTVQLAITMLDQLFPEDAGKTSFGDLSEAARAWLLDVQDEAETDISFIGTGTRTHFETDLG